MANLNIRLEAEQEKNLEFLMMKTGNSKTDIIYKLLNLGASLEQRMSEALELGNQFPKIDSFCNGQAQTYYNLMEYLNYKNKSIKINNIVSQKSSSRRALAADIEIQNKKGANEDA